MKVSKPEIKLIKIDNLNPYKNNARKHSPKQIKQIANSIERFGFTNPLIVDEGYEVLAGHGRLEAAKSINLNEVPCLIVKDLDSLSKKAYIIADNKIAENASWDFELLAEELEELSSYEYSFDLDITGFETSEIDLIIDDYNNEESGNPQDNELPAGNEVEARCKNGDLWQLGGHRLICGDSQDSAVVEELINKESAAMVFTDPPYNVQINGHVGGKASIKHSEFAMASGEMTREEFTKFLKTSFSNLANNSKKGSIHYICMDWRHIKEITAAGEEVYSEFKNLIVWAKDNGGMGTFYRSRHELIFIYKNGSAQHINNFELGQHGRYRTNVWEYSGVIIFINILFFCTFRKLYPKLIFDFV